MVANKALQRDWSSLPPELLNLFAKKLHEISDFLRFRAVCTAWYSSTNITDLPLQFPWILEKRRDPLEADLCFYSVPFGKIYTINAPKFFGKHIFMLSNGYICVFMHIDWDSLGKHTFHEALLNPLTNHEIPIPAYSFGLSASFIKPWQNQMGFHMVCTGHLADQKLKLLSYHIGQSNWCELTLASAERNWNIFHLSGMLFMVERESGSTKVVDIATDTLAFVIPPIEGYSPKGRTYIVDACGDILRVFQHYDISEGLYHYWFDVQRLDISRSSSPRWIKVKCIGNQALFVDVFDCFVLCASDFAGIRANCIYSLMKIYQGMHKEYLYRVERIDIETGAREHVPCHLKEPDRWFVPSLRHL
ncbi:hypothetical protein LUZ63_013076 [Rhynchospora breviuscula]|uniref:KIB1-4 beta-propeller domain-containing protein n=1 Tax=Rhynchospora breviuscula TaxID=2022672 RepID=A0A9Q0C7V1_9POAL|nr:hypothetical protein LUZ63_013076 [Rhynchospora breviuscula]